MYGIVTVDYASGDTLRPYSGVRDIDRHDILRSDHYEAVRSRFWRMRRIMDSPHSHQIYTPT